MQIDQQMTFRTSEVSQHIMPRKPDHLAIHTVVHSDSHVYIDSFTTLYDAMKFIDTDAPGHNAWKIISKVIR